MLRSTVLMVLLVACDAGQPPAKPAPPAPPAPKQVAAELPSPDPQPLPTRHRHAIPRKDLVTADTDDKLLPVHGVVVHAWGMEGDSLVAVDADKRMVRRIENILGKPKVDRTRKLDQKKLDEVMKVALAAWDEDQNGDMPQATDIREDLIVLDGDEAFYLSGSPIGGGPNNTGRPVAGRAVDALYETSK